MEGRTFLTWGAGLAFVGVAAGAFGAHGLQGRISSDLLDVYETAVQYQLYHAVGLLVVGALSHWYGGTALAWAGRFFVAGTIVFSGSLFVLALTGARWLGAVTPIGGVCFLLGWAALMRGLVLGPESPQVTERNGTHPHI